MRAKTHESESHWMRTHIREPNRKNAPYRRCRRPESPSDLPRARQESRYARQWARPYFSRPSRPTRSVCYYSSYRKRRRSERNVSRFLAFLSFLPSAARTCRDVFNSALHLTLCSALYPRRKRVKILKHQNLDGTGFRASRDSLGLPQPSLLQ